MDFIIARYQFVDGKTYISNRSLKGSACLLVAVSLRLKIRGMGMLLQFNLIGRSVFNAPLAPGSMHVDDAASVYIMVACTPLPLC